MLLLAARLVLAAVFVVAGLAKLADLPGSRQAMRDFGVPQPLAGLFGSLLPIAELATAVLLIPLATAWYGGLAALALLLLFIVGISLTMARGQAPDCHCFGQLHAEPVGWSTILRNSLLSLIALVLLVEGRRQAGTSALGWLGHVSTAEGVGIGVGVLVALVLIGQGWLLLHLLQQNGRLLTRLDALEAAGPLGTAAGTRPAPAPAAPVAGLPVGSVAPSFALTGLHGETLTLDALRAATKPVLLVFSDPHCGPCNTLLPEIGQWQRQEASRLTIALISRGSVEENRAKGTEHGLTQVLLQQDREVAERYQSYGTPSAVLIRPDGRIDSPLAMGSEQIRTLVQQSTGKLPLAPAPVPARNGNGHPRAMGMGRERWHAGDSRRRSSPSPISPVTPCPSPTSLADARCSSSGIRAVASASACWRISRPGKPIPPRMRLPCCWSRRERWRRIGSWACARPCCWIRASVWVGALAPPARLRRCWSSRMAPLARRWPSARRRCWPWLALPLRPKAPLPANGTPGSVTNDQPGLRVWQSPRGSTAHIAAFPIRSGVPASPEIYRSQFNP